MSRHLFSLPLEHKLALRDPILNRGYTPLGEETLDPVHQSKGDTKEGYYIGAEEVLDAAHFRGPNVWPSRDAFNGSEEFLGAMMRYFREMNRVGLTVVRLVALALGLPRHYFDEMFSHPIALLRLLHYSGEKSSVEEGTMGCGAHSDYGMITLLALQEGDDCLEILHEGEWISIRPEPGVLVVNLGDMLEQWTNGLFSSTKHRVVNRRGEERYSIPFFFEPNFDTLVECLEVCCSQHNPPRYPPTTSGEYLIQKYKETHDDYSPPE